MNDDDRRAIDRALEHLSACTLRPCLGCDAARDRLASAKVVVAEGHPAELTHSVELGHCRCGRKISAHPRNGTAPPSIHHEMPPCPDFVRLDLFAYLAWVRKGRAN